MLQIYFFLKKLLSYAGMGLFMMRFPRDFEQDGLATSRVRGFAFDERFKEAKSKTIDSIGRDFEIDWRSHVFLRLLTSSRNTAGNGLAVELGTGKAWMFTLASHYCSQSELGECILIDRFDSSSVDPITGQVTGKGEHPSYSGDFEGIKARFDNLPSISVVKGELPDLLFMPLLKTKLQNIRFLHIDLNAAEPEVQSLKFLWERLLPGAVVLLDDYGSPEFGQSFRAMNDLGVELGFQILSLPTGQGVIFRPHPAIS